MENANIAKGTTISDEVDYSLFSGRFNPGFSEAVTTFMINPFVKYKGLEFFGTIEKAGGRSISETSTRQASQYAADLIYRFPEKTQNFWIGVRYNTLTAAMQGDALTGEGSKERWWKPRSDFEDEIIQHIDHGIWCH